MCRALYYAKQGTMKFNRPELHAFLEIMTTTVEASMKAHLLRKN